MKSAEVLKTAQQVKDNHYCCPGNCSDCLYEIANQTTDDCNREKFKKLIDDIVERKLFLMIFG
jgi:hypothetical protein